MDDSDNPEADGFGGCAAIFVSAIVGLGIALIVAQLAVWVF